MHRPRDIPGYRLRECLGKGPTCFVYSAVHEATGQPCAVKVLRDDWTVEPRALTLLRREAQVGQAVRHPHLVRFLTAHVDHFPFYLVMELLPGETLRRRLRRSFALDVFAALGFARQVAEALAALHRAGFIHGDVKPENVRLTDAGTARLVDLGFARRPGDDAELLEQGVVLGTANYVPPELCHTHAEDVSAGDVFSLGVTLFELLTGGLPYPDGSTQETMRRHRDERPATLLDHGDAWPLGLPGLVNRMLARLPEDRPTAAALVRELVTLQVRALNRRAGLTAPRLKAR